MVAFNEFTGSPTFPSIRPNGARAIRRGRIAWTDINAFIALVFPPTILSGDEVTQFAGRPFPGANFLRASNLIIEPASAKSSTTDTTQDFDTVLDYNFADVTIEYSTPEATQTKEESDNEGDPVPFLTHNWKLGGEFMTLPTQGFFWELTFDDLGDDVDVGKFIPSVEHAITWPRVRNPPFAIMRDRVGKVNNAAFTFSTGVIAVETLLFLGAELKRDIMSNGKRAWEVTYRFSERIVAAEDDDTATTTKTIGGWNHFYRSDSVIQPNPGFYRVVRTSAGDGPYLTASFAELFKAAT